MSLLVACCAIAATIALLLWLRRPVESAPAQPKTVVLGSAGSAVPAIPRRLWSYWHSDDVPLVVTRCLENWRHHCPGWDIQLIVGDALHRHVESGALPDGFDGLPPARRSDWLRLHLLARHGGVWIDASTILTTSLDWMRETQQRSGAHYLGYYLEGFGVEGRPPVVESWAMAAPAGSPFVLAWAGELDRALAVGDAAYLDALQQEGRYARLRQRISRPAYLIIHICAQAVLDRVPPWRLHLLRAEDSAYFLQHCSHWRRLRLYRRLLAHPAPALAPVLIKLRGGERRKLEGYLAHGLYRRDSIVGRYLHGPAARSVAPRPVATAYASQPRRERLRPARHARSNQPRLR